MKKKQTKVNKKKHRTNEEIRAFEVSLISETGDLLGTMSSRDALVIAKGKNLDLVEISPNVKPPVCKVMDYGRFQYETKKKESLNKKKSTTVDTKEIQLGLKIDKHDFEIKLKQAEKFISEGNMVRFVLRRKYIRFLTKDQCDEFFNKIGSYMLEFSDVKKDYNFEKKDVTIVYQPSKAKKKNIEKKAVESKKEQTVSVNGEVEEKNEVEKLPE